MSKTTTINSKEKRIIEELLNESALTELFESLVSEDIQNVEIIETYDCNNEHVGLIVEVRSKITDEIERIIIDAVIGYPATEQVYETVYKRDSNCDKRIIIYTEGLAELDTYGGENDDAIKNLVENLNTYGTNIFLGRVKNDSDKNQFIYEVTARPPESQNYKLLDLPSEAKLKEEEFWAVYYWQQFEDVYCPWKTFTGPLHEPRKFGHVYGPDGAELYVKWTDQGLFFEAIEVNDESAYLEPIWNSRRHELQMLYPDAEMTFIMEPGKLPKLIIKVWTTPVYSLVNASVSEKKRLAKEILKNFGNFIDIITDSLSDVKSENKEQFQEAEHLA